METKDALALEKLKLGARVAGFGLIDVDYITDTVRFDHRAARIFDLPENTPIPRQHLHDRIHPADWPFVKIKLDELVDPDGANFIDVEHRVIKGDGTIVWVNARKEIEFQLDPEVGGLIPFAGMAAVLDVSARKENENHIRFLLKELNHRSRNLMSVVHAIARMSTRGEAEEVFVERFAHRLRALANNQNALMEDCAGLYSLRALIECHLIPFEQEGSERLEITGPAIQLGPSVAQALGMAIHELATNAIKYGALGSPLGKVLIKWSVSAAPQPMFTLSWSEIGGPPVSQPSRSGFGQQVVKNMIAGAVNGTTVLDFNPTGIRWQLVAPLQDVGVVAAADI